MPLRNETNGNRELVTGCGNRQFLVTRQGQFALSEETEAGLERTGKEMKAVNLIMHLRDPSGMENKRLFGRITLGHNPQPAHLLPTYSFLH